jgi:hypothetical protein
MTCYVFFLHLDILLVDLVSVRKLRIDLKQRNEPVVLHKTDQRNLQFGTVTVECLSSTVLAITL